MAENKIKQVAELLGVEIGVPFRIKGTNCEYKITKNGLINSKDVYNSIKLKDLLIGKLEIEKPILDKVEKRYLEGVLRPFKDRVMSIKKNQNKYDCYDDTYIYVCLKRYDGINDDNLLFPCFSKDDMYKGMALNKRYTLEELGLFED